MSTLLNPSFDTDSVCGPVNWISQFYKIRQYELRLLQNISHLRNRNLDNDNWNYSIKKIYTINLYLNFVLNCIMIMPLIISLLI